MNRERDIRFMRRCLELAGKAEGRTYPNPMVGSVIVYNDIIIGEGYHLRAGDAHAEVNAINSVKNKEILKSTTLYVNLEPCCHHGKTPPCTDLIISHGIKKVVIGTIDTSEKVNGRGIALLEDAGCEVKTGVLEQECRWLNRRFFTFIEKKRPYIILKLAQSADGYIDTSVEGSAVQKPVWITGAPERVLVHRWRAAEQSILAGAGTVRSDDPRLNVRHWTGNDPLRIILSGSGMIGKDLSLFKTNGTNIVFTNNTDADLPNVEKVKLKGNTNPAFQIAEYLYGKGIQSLIVEGGALVMDLFISTGLWDEARIFTGIRHFKSGVKAPAVTGKKYSSTAFSMSSLDLILNRMSLLTG
jgi:diaminohydroxyphosphoribosylaminopyrimidine deaminase/5-amino-6-(5-phosphoribosylamino)uracil reductase